MQISRTLSSVLSHNVVTTHGKMAIFEQKTDQL